MKRKIILMVILTLSFLSYDVSAQSNKKQIRAERKQARQEAATLSFNQAEDALNTKNWVLEANTLFNSQGSSTQVNSNTNFISVQGEEVYVQLAFNGYEGYNGIGGVTLKGKTTKYKITKSKKGNVTLHMLVVGTALTVEVFLQLGYAGYATAEVDQVTTSSRLKFAGNLVNADNSTFYKSGLEY